MSRPYSDTQADRQREGSRGKKEEKTAQISGCYHVSATCLKHSAFPKSNCTVPLQSSKLRAARQSDRDANRLRCKRGPTTGQEE